MSETLRAAPRRTALYDAHRQAGARLIDFAGWEMPLEYAGIIQEHRAVRSTAGIFDLSHMGELWVQGPEAAQALAYAVVSDPTKLDVGRAQYSLMVAEDGGIIDDLIVYRTADDRFLIVPNASNAPSVATALEQRLRDSERSASLEDASLRTSLIAVQGPNAWSILEALTDVDLRALKYYAIAEGHVAGTPAWVARTGYTGEDGFELFVDWDAAPALWQRLLEVGAKRGLVSAGLGARDTLRLEAGMALYGNELDRETRPAEAGLGRVVKLDKEADFVGREALQKAADEGPLKSLVGLQLRGRGIARHGYPVYRPDDQAHIGSVTSGTLSPTLGTAIAMAYVPAEQAVPGTMLEVGVRATRVPAEVVPLPFYRRPA